jgi:2-polyprenyl-3-methyl-5-hydroxy-6-metoxy-1,4-benzoquinol methylase
MPELSLDQLGRYYPDAYYSLDENIQMEASRVSRLFRNDRMNRIRRYVLSGKLLDIGSGTGMFLKTAREHGFEVHGLEISKSAATFGGSTWGLDIKQGNLQDSILPPDQYDVVTLWHVFEHLHEPLVVAKQLYDLTKPKGLLVIAVPNFASVQAHLFRGHWFHLDVPRHLFHHTPKSITTIVEAAGFKTVGMNFFSREHNWAGILGSVMRLSPPRERFVHKAVRKLIGVPLTKSVAFLEAMTGRGGTLEIYARK